VTSTQTNLVNPIQNLRTEIITVTQKDTRVANGSVSYVTA